MILWFFGNSGAGKTTIIKELRKIREFAYLDSAIIGKYIAPKNADYSENSRKERYTRLLRMAEGLAQMGIDVIIESILPTDSIRTELRRLHLYPSNKLSIAPLSFVHVYATIEVCKKRDPKGLWKKEPENELQMWEKPEVFDLEIDTTAYTIDEAVDIIARSFRESAVFYKLYRKEK